MDILVAIAASWVAQGVKVLTARFGKDVAGEIIFIALFVFAGVYTLAQSEPNVMSYVTHFVAFIGAAELNYRKVLSRVSWMLPPPPGSSGQGSGS